uniref:Conserved membrane protein n=1 Tax=uncultured bacterium contig00017 TaxID=1181508 RepID=A0A806KML5_9BACT|nr:conserved membrane protein [uncultured bacterium contig00017]
MSNKAKVLHADLFFFLTVLFVIPLNIVILYISQTTGWQMSALANVLISQGYFIVCVSIYCLAARQKVSETLRIRKFHLGSAFLVLVLLLTASPVAYWLNAASQLFVTNEVATTIYDISVDIPYLAGILVIGALPALVEEIICRGVLLSAHSLRSLRAGIIISAVAFACLHMDFNQMAYAFFLGLLFALIVEATGSILSTMLAHAVFNAVSVSFVYLLPFIIELQESLTGMAAEMGAEEMLTQGAGQSEILLALLLLTPFAGAGLVLSGLLLYLIAKLNQREEIFMSLYKKEYKENAPVDRSVPLVNPFLVAGFVVCLVMALFGALATMAEY